MPRLVSDAYRRLAMLNAAVAPFTAIVLALLGIWEGQAMTVLYAMLVGIFVTPYSREAVTAAWLQALGSKGSTDNP